MSIMALDRDADLAARILSDLQAREGGVIRDGRLYPLAPVLADVEDYEEIIALDTGVCWFATHTEVRAEFRVEEGLREAGFPTFLPTLTRYIRHARRVAERRLALFPRYVFVAFNPEKDDWGSIGRIDGVSALLQIDGRPLKVPDRLISKIMVDDLLRVNDETVVAPVRSSWTKTPPKSKQKGKNAKSWKGRKERYRLREERRRQKGLGTWLREGLANSDRM